MSTPKKKPLPRDPVKCKARAITILKVVVSGNFAIKMLDHPEQLQGQIKDAIELLEES